MSTWPIVDIPPPIVDREWVSYAAGLGVVVIDNSPVFRLDPRRALGRPEVNPHAGRATGRCGIIANPGATVMTMIDAVAVLHAGWQLEELVVTTFQAASGRGPGGDVSGSTTSSRGRR
jgi:aspartate-semialdehyde dehydrogenase